jgi:hypothetical protein
MAISSATGLSDAQHGVQLRRAVVASTVGTIIEAYDFLLYVQVAPLLLTISKRRSACRSWTLQAAGVVDEVRTNSTDFIGVSIESGLDPPRSNQYATRGYDHNGAANLVLDRF